LEQRRLEREQEKIDKQLEIIEKQIEEQKNRSNSRSGIDKSPQKHYQNKDSQSIKKN
jgi:hypothetical protein